MRKGFVYVLSNPSMPGVLKIGKTTRSVDERARELSNETGIPTSFVVEHSTETIDCHNLERAVHYRLVKERVNDKREFFKLDLKDAINIVECVCKEIDPEYNIRQDIAARIEKERIIREAKLQEKIRKKKIKDQFEKDIQERANHYMNHLYNGYAVTIYDSEENCVAIYNKILDLVETADINITCMRYDSSRTIKPTCSSALTYGVVVVGWFLLFLLGGWIKFS